MRSSYTLASVFILIAALVWTFSPGNFFARDVCERTLQYRIGTFDTRFGVDRETFLGMLRQAEAVWEGPTGLNLFEYDEQGTLPVNLIFDERQERTLLEERDRQTLSTLQAAYDNLSREHQILFETYQSSVQVFETKRESYRDRLDAYNESARMWNEKGGAPSSIYQELQREREALHQVAENLERDRQELNRRIVRLNELGRDSNVVAQEYNRGIQTYKSRFGGVHEFNQGEYSDGTITIYQFDDPVELPLVLAHELGHALGIEHVPNAESVMYYLMGDQMLDPVTLSGEDLGALQAKCR